MTSPARAPRPTPRRDARHEAAPTRGRHLRVVEPAPRPSLRRRRTGAVFCVATAVVFTSLMASAFFHGMLVSGQSHLDRVNADLEHQRAELANLQSPARIAAEAAKLGMVPAAEQHWLSPSGQDEVVTGTGNADPATTDPATADPNGTGTNGTTPTPAAGGTSELATGTGGARTR